MYQYGEQFDSETRTLLKKKKEKLNTILNCGNNLKKYDKIYIRF